MKSLRYIILGFVLIACSGKDTKEIEIADNVTWSEHIAPIIFKTCTPCHRPGEAGTFDLLTYGDAVRNANKMNN